MKKILFCFLFFYAFNIISQENKNALTWFDNIIKQENLDINSGVKYSEKYRSPKGNHRFLLDEEFYNSSVTYNNQVYYNIPIKYDIHEDVLIAKINSNAGNRSLILTTEKITSFTLNNEISLYKYNKAFYERLYQTNEVHLLKKHHKRRTETVVRNIVLSKFKQNDSFFLFIDNKLQSITKRSDWYNLFPEDKKLIKDFYRQEKKLLKRSKTDFYRNLTRQILR